MNSRVEEVVNAQIGIIEMCETLEEMNKYYYRGSGGKYMALHLGLINDKEADQLLDRLVEAKGRWCENHKIKE